MLHSRDSGRIGSLRVCSMGQEEWASLQHGLQLLAAHFLSDELSVFVLLNFVTSMYALGAFVTKVCKMLTSTLLLALAIALDMPLYRLISMFVQLVTRLEV